MVERLRAFPLTELLAVILVGSAWPGLANDAAVQQVNADAVRALPRFDLPRGHKRSSFFVLHPDAPRSAAWRDNTDCKPKSGHIPAPSAGYELCNRVIVQSHDPQAIATIGAELAATDIRPLAVRGFWIVQFDTVAEALDAATILSQDQRVESAEPDMLAPFTLRALPTDPSLDMQWHLRNTLDPLFDVNAEDAWNLGYTGSGVVIGIIDAAIETDHPDLAANWLAIASDGSTAPATNPHGTNVAGIAAAVGNNGLFGAGIAYGAQFSTHVLGDASVNAEALARRNDLNDIKSNSWGPLDSGIAHPPFPAIQAAIEQGVQTGRDGRGVVYVWAAGNGNSVGDRVEYDPLASSRYTISVGAIGDQDWRAAYSEQGSSLMLVTQSDGNVRRIYTTTLNGNATSTFGGTSAACPLAAGAAALVLEANPALHWRDVRQIMIDSARKNDPTHAAWRVNGAGRAIHLGYGFGAVDAGAAVALAENWERLPHEVMVDSGVVPVGQAVPDNQNSGVTVSAVIDQDIVIETVELFVNVQSLFIGDLQIEFTSPSGTRSIVARRRGDSQDHYVDYEFTSVRHMGERTAGAWTVKISDRAAGDLATWQDFRLVFHGIPVCSLDLNGSGVFDLGDLESLLMSFGACEADASFNPAADITNDGCNDLSDLAELLARFGQACP